MKKIIAGLAAGMVLGFTVSSYGAEIAEFLVEKANFPVLVNGKEFKTDKAIVTINGSTYMPLRAVGEALGVKVNWNSDLNRVEIGEMPTESKYSFSNPAPMGVSQTIHVSTPFESYKAEMTVKEVIRGDQAWQKIKAANQFNTAAQDGYEYILVKVYFKLLDIPDGKIYELTGQSSIKAVSGDGREYEYKTVVKPDPKLDTKLYKGSSSEGWAVYMVKKDDPNPKLVLGRNYDGTGGIWFKAY